MAKAYGGLAKGQPIVMRKGQMPNRSNRMMTADINNDRMSNDHHQRNLSKLAGSISGYQKDNANISRDRLDMHNFGKDANVTNHSFLEGTNEPSIMAVPDHHIRE